MNVLRERPSERHQIFTIIHSPSPSGFTKRAQNQECVFTYAQTAQLRKIRKKMVQIMQSEIAKGELRDAVKMLVVDKLCDEIKKQTNRIYPLEPVHIIKAKLIKAPKAGIH